MRQGCSLSPLLFMILLANLEEDIRKSCWGGIKVGDEKIYTLLYANDVVLLAENEEEMKCIMARLDRYLGKKERILNVEKSKVMRFRKGGGKMRKVEWW